LGHGALTRNIELVGLADRVQRSRQVVAEHVDEMLSDRLFVPASASQIDRHRRGLSTADAFRMVMRDHCGPLGLLHDVVERVVGEPDRADSHRRAVAPTVVWFAAAQDRPFDEGTAKTTLRVTVEIVV